MVGGGDPF